MLLHHTEELDNDLRTWPDQDLALSCLFCVVDGLEGIVQDTGFDHDGDGYEILNSSTGGEVSA